ncbi:LANO_0B06084g1_1 [Lachancea nothofagi CBS 11611]|uniref:LANO_0B06084g1_1 n=1 Tax=Lachancea nothofagi CBS 11611 TaxID=1266666 RepID=A0A1G4IZ13_9SACH|nr:LANO_0B06084g1_1 [Lachancea nothofagi CBS 11611]
MILSKTLKLRTMATMRTWNESVVIMDKKSKFQGRCCSIKSQDEIPKILQTLVDSNKSVSKASHQHMYAWRTGETAVVQVLGSKRGKKGAKVETQIRNLEQGFSDCGEAGAGQRLLVLLERSGVVNVLVVVTRWYGGTPLGSARFRHIAAAGVESLKKSGWIS